MTSTPQPGPKLLQRVEADTHDRNTICGGPGSRLLSRTSVNAIFNFAVDYIYVVRFPGVSLGIAQKSKLIRASRFTDIRGVRGGDMLRTYIMS